MVLAKLPTSLLDQVVMRGAGMVWDTGRGDTSTEFFLSWNDSVFQATGLVGTRTDDPMGAVRASLLSELKKFILLDCWSKHITT